MFFSALKKFDKMRKTSFNAKEYDLSSYELFELVLNKNIKKGRLYFLEFPMNLILALLSLYSIIKAKIKNIQKVNYFIAYNDQIYDPRTDSYLSKIEHRNFLNIIRTNNFKVSIKAFIKYENVFFHQSIVYFSRFFLIEKVFSLKEKFLHIHRCNIRKQKIYSFFFKFLKIKKLIMIDDYREIQSFLMVCQKLNISSVGIMHARFSKFRVSLKYSYFDKYIVWTQYFKKKLIEINPKYKNKIIINNFRNFKRIKKTRLSHELRILFFSDHMMDYESVINYLNQLKNKKIKIFIKLKNNQNENKNFLKYINDNNFVNINVKSVSDAVKKYNPDFFIATNSNVLLEATLYDCFPILLKTKNDYSFDLIKDKVVFQYSDKKDFYSFLKKLKTKKYLLNNIYNKLWKSTNKDLDLKKILS